METESPDRRRARRFGLVIFLLLLVIAGSYLSVSAAEPLPVVHPEDRGSVVQELQGALQVLGLYRGAVDGIYGQETRVAVEAFQHNYGLVVDGVVGARTWTGLMACVAGVEPVTVSKNTVQVIPWERVKVIFKRGDIARVTDVKSGRSFQVKRMGGSLHADAEPLTRGDTEALKAIYGGWSWVRRAIVVEVGGVKIAGSMNGFPHGFQSITNGFPGHFCLHFYGSKLHKTRKMDKDHQRMVLAAAGLSYQ